MAIVETTQARIDKLQQLENICGDIMIFWEKDGIIPETFFKELGKVLGWRDYQDFKGVCERCLDEKHEGDCQPILEDLPPEAF